MGLFDGWFGRKNPWDRFEALGPHERLPALKALAERVVAVTNVEKPVYATHLAKSHVELRGTLQGFPLRLILSSSGSVEDLDLRYADDDLPYLDLEFDPNLERDAQRNPPPDLEPWDGKRKLILAPGVSIAGSSAEKEAKIFRALPLPLQERITRVMRHHHVRYFRSRRDEISVEFLGGISAMPDPVVQFRDVLRLCAEVSEARGARPPCANREPRSVVEEAAPLARAEPEVQGWMLAKSLATRIVEKVADARVVERADDEAIDVRFFEGGVPVRVVIDAKFDDLDASARAEGVEAELVLERDSDVEITRDSDDGDEWETPGARQLFLSRSVFVSGSDLETRRQAAVLRAMEPEALDALVETMERLELAHVSLSEAMLSTSLCNLEEVTDGGRTAIEVARLLGRVAKVLPRGEAPVAIKDRPQPCARCGAQSVWSTGPCVRCH